MCANNHDKKVLLYVIQGQIQNNEQLIGWNGGLLFKMRDLTGAKGFLRLITIRLQRTPNN